MGIDYVYMDEFILWLDSITDQKSIHDFGPEFADVIQKDFWEII